MRGRKVRHGITKFATFDRQYLEPRVGEFLSKNGSRPPEANQNDIDRLELRNHDSTLPHCRSIPTLEPDGGLRVGLAVLFDFRDIVVARTGEPDQLPAREIAVAAIDRIREKTFIGVLPEHREELFGRGAHQFDLALLEAMKNFILIVYAEFRKTRLIECPLAI